MKKTILVTGAYGFAGSHFIQHALNMTDYNIVALYSFRHLGCPTRAIENDRVKNIYFDLNAPITDRLKKYIGDVDYIANLAAQSHVERSIEDPVPFVQNNVNSVLHILEFARSLPNLKAFAQISTDEVYGPAIGDDKHEEWREILPSNPYAASKAAQEAIAISYWRTYGVPVFITNTMNMIGPRQDDEKFIPMCIKKIMNDETVTIHGTKGNIGSRQYLHAKSHADAILWIIKNIPVTKYNPEIQSLQKPDRYNVVGELEMNNLEVAMTLAELLNKNLNYKLVDFHSARPGHDKRYALNGNKLKELGWQAPFSIQYTLEETAQYALDNKTWMK